MKWTLNRIWLLVGITIGIASVVGVVELVSYNQDSKSELSNNITIIVEVAVGFTIAVIVYGLTNIEKKKTDNEIKNIRDIAARLEAVSYKIEKEQIVRNLGNLQLLLQYNILMSVLHKKINDTHPKNQETMKEHLSHLKLYYKQHAKTVDHTPVLHTDEDITASSTTAMFENIDIYWQKEYWRKLVTDLEVMIGLKHIIEKYNKEEKEKFDKLKLKYDSRIVQSE